MEGVLTLRARFRSLRALVSIAIAPIASMVAVVTLAVTAVVRLGVVESGFKAKTMWDWLDMLVVPIAGVWLAGLFALARARADKRSEEARELAEERTQVETLSAYLEGMQELITVEHLLSSTENGPVKAVARARTLAALRILNGTRKGILLRFLHEAGLVDGPAPRLELTLADLTDVDLVGAELKHINLEGANLRRGDLNGAILQGAHLQGALLNDADLGFADLTDATVDNAQLATCRGLLEARLPAGNRVDEEVWAALLQAGTGSRVVG